jgi:hypothetical protein
VRRKGAKSRLMKLSENAIRKSLGRSKEWSRSMGNLSLNFRVSDHTDGVQSKAVAFRVGIPVSQLLCLGSRVQFNYLSPYFRLKAEWSGFVPAA